MDCTLNPTVKHQLERLEKYYVNYCSKTNTFYIEFFLQMFESTEEQHLDLQNICIRNNKIEEKYHVSTAMDLCFSHLDMADIVFDFD